MFLLISLKRRSSMGECSSAFIRLVLPVCSVIIIKGCLHTVFLLTSKDESLPVRSFVEELWNNIFSVPSNNPGHMSKVVFCVCTWMRGYTPALCEEINVHCLYAPRIICSARCSCWPVTFRFHSAMPPKGCQWFNTDMREKYCKCQWFHPITSSSHCVQQHVLISEPCSSCAPLRNYSDALFVSNQSLCWGYSTFPHFETLWMQDVFATLSKYTSTKEVTNRAWRILKFFFCCCCYCFFF